MRPELQSAPETFYDEHEAQSYKKQSRIKKIQSEMTNRAMELLNLPEEESLLILDIGCGTGLSGEVVSERGHCWIGMDISPSMLKLAAEDSNVEGDLCLHDMGQGLPWRVGAFDAAISISAIQWLCNADKKSHDPRKRLNTFFSTLYACLRKGARAVFQFYPQDSQQTNLIANSALKNGFSGGVVVDYPNSTKARKFYLVIFAGVPDAKPPPALEDETVRVRYQASNVEREHFRARNSGDGKKKKKASFRSKEWIIQKKERARKKGKEVRPDSKYTGRKRSGRF
uniref:18S rRNA (guanine(1575)-N(7))-methyltransferase Bud23 C-terminal domain-containing protein n=1 Tax=Percolomonas cosmopolitus TaxID=63605 RepID=A0A7S1KP02_9EUKA|mmetsp:Transcript_3494/g.13341  ORF Transcript_3494/g.13341 Transcript_3494/m.13341 type:complete len:284 (+) Transcript_3494:73-924(+)